MLVREFPMLFSDKLMQTDVIMPFGMKNSGATFQRLMNSVIIGLDGVDVYIDDLIVYSNTWKEHLKRLRALSKMKDKNQKILRWFLFLQRYNLSIVHIKGKDNVVADALSRV